MESADDGRNVIEVGTGRLGSEVQLARRSVNRVDVGDGGTAGHHGRDLGDSVARRLGGCRGVCSQCGAWRFRMDTPKLYLVITRLPIRGLRLDLDSKQFRYLLRDV
jgi:hypothetical protein